MSSFNLKKTILFSLIGVGLVGMMTAGIVLAWLFKSLQPLDPQKTQRVEFVIPKGQAILTIGRRLEEERLIKSAFAFRYLVWQKKLSGKIQAGTFQLAPSESLGEIVQKLTMGINDVRVTIPEGKRHEELSEYFKDFPNFDSDEFVALSEDEEGYLFPDTYSFAAGATAEIVHEKLRSNFDKVIKDNSIEAKAKKSGATLKNAVIMASIVEREAKTAEDMKIVAGILYNRLQNGMPLQVDATMQYAKGYDTKTKQWWAPPLAADKEINSPFNTYKVTGLPPAPICNPSLNALNAAVSPTSSDYLFYITDNDGQMRYAETYDEHLENIQKFLR